MRPRTPRRPTLRSAPARTTPARITPRARAPRRSFSLPDKSRPPGGPVRFDPGFWAILPLMPDPIVMPGYQTMIEEAFERRSEITPLAVNPGLAQALDQILDELNTGRLRVAEKIDGAWVTHQWVKKAVLLYFRVHDNRVMPGGGRAWFDKVPLRFAGYTEEQFRQDGFRVVPPATVRAGAFIGRNVEIGRAHV